MLISLRLLIKGAFADACGAGLALDVSFPRLRRRNIRDKETFSFTILRFPLARPPLTIGGAFNDVVLPVMHLIVVFEIKAKGV